MSRVFVTGSRSIPTTTTNYAESEHKVWRELGSGEVWEMARRPLKGSGLHNPSLEPRVWTGQHRSRVTLPKLRPQLETSDLTPRRSPMDQTKEDRKREAFCRYKVPAQTQREFGVTFQLSYSLQFGWYS